jgi:hypothetical protein
MYFPMKCAIPNLQFLIFSGNSKMCREVVTTRTPADKECEKSSTLCSLQSKIWGLSVPVLNHNHLRLTAVK